MAITFASSADIIYYPVPGAPVDQGTVAFWMKTSQVLANVSVASYWSGSSRDGYGFIMNNVANKLSFIAYGVASQRVLLTSTSNINNGVWRHIAAVYDRVGGNSNQLYIDGALDVSVNASAGWTTPSTNYYFNLGDSIDTFWGSYVGDTAEVAQWTTKLTADDVASLARGVGPMRVRPDALQLYAPQVREIRPVKMDWTPVANVAGTTVGTHPPMLGGLA